MTTDEWIVIDSLLTPHGWCVERVEETIDFNVNTNGPEPRGGMVQGEARVTVVSKGLRKPPEDVLRIALRQYGYLMHDAVLEDVREEYDWQKQIGRLGARCIDFGGPPTLHVTYNLTRIKRPVQ